jgi:hypothetical protein
VSKANFSFRDHLVLAIQIKEWKEKPEEPSGYIFSFNDFTREKKK